MAIENLSNFSNEELLDLVKEGDITDSEFWTEMTRRQSSKPSKTGRTRVSAESVATIQNEIRTFLDENNTPMLLKLIAILSLFAENKLGNQFNVALDTALSELKSHLSSDSLSEVFNASSNTKVMKLLVPIKSYIKLYDKKTDNYNLKDFEVALEEYSTTLSSTVDELIAA